jgi:predicted RNA-binding Zn ribbon-like protein
MAVAHSTDAVEPGTRPPAPEPLRLVQRFLNSVDIEGSQDAFDGPIGVRQWLASVGLPGSRSPLSDADVARVVELREAIRDVLEGRTHGAPSDSALRRFDRAAGQLPLRVRASADGIGLAPGRSAGLAAALGRILGVLAQAAADGTLDRLKVCSNDVCRWAYFDASRNRSGRWCTMAICGNRIKSRAFRGRSRNPAEARAGAGGRG